MEQPPNTKTVVIDDPALQQFVGGFTVIPNRVLRSAEISVGAKLAYSLLLSYAWQKNFCFPAQEQLAKDLGGGERSIRRYLVELRTFGLITWRQIGLNRPNVYHILKLPEMFHDPESDWKTVENQGPAKMAGPGWPIAAQSRSGQNGRSRTANVAGQERQDWPPKNTQRINTQNTRVDDDLEGGQGDRIARLFHNLMRHESAEPARKECAQAADLVREHGKERAEFIVRYAVEAAAQTHFAMRTFGAVLQYVPDALKAAKKDDRRRERELAERRAQAAESLAREQARAAWLALSLEERIEQSVERWLSGRQALRATPSAREIEEKRAYYRAVEERNEREKETQSAS